MSTKFEQLLDYLVNEEHEKANELFHEIVVEKSREIYENLISEEEDEEMDEAKEEEMDESSEDEEMDESKEEEMDEAKEEDEELEEAEDEEADESMDLEDSYMMDADETGDATDDLGGEISADGDNFDAPADDEHDHEGQEDNAIMDIKNAIAELEKAFAELEHAQGSEEAEMGDEEGEEGDEADEMMGMPAMEGRRMTREYVEKVGNDWEKSGTQKAQGKNVAAGSGDTESAPVDGKSPVSSGKGKPTTGANASQIAQNADEGQSNTGTSPLKVQKGITPESGEKFAKDAENVPGGKMGVKNLKKVGSGYPNNNKNPGPVGAGTGDKAGQTSVDPATKKQFLPQFGKK